jgi:2-amino-4-hydroxy-6-hydroxymethyldihydropteridine diphosphokinase
MRAGVALGSNLGERLANLRNARKEIVSIQGALPPLRCSAIYETEPVNCEPGAPKFFNAVVEFGYTGRPEELRRHERNVSRPIDLDLLYFGDVVTETAELRLPHPRIVDREFVLRPLADIRPDLVLPKQTETVSALLLRLPRSGVVRLDLQW